MERPFFHTSNDELAILITKGNKNARAEGVIRHDKRIARGRKPHSAVAGALAKTTVAVPTPAPAPAPTPAPAPESGPDIEGMIARAVAAALAAHMGAPAPTPAPEPETHTDDARVWAECLAECGGSRWAAYDMMEAKIGKRQRRRIAEAAGVTVGSVANAISKYRRGETPDLSFIGR
jgi:hypothetical protein